MAGSWAAYANVYTAWRLCAAVVYLALVRPFYPEARVQAPSSFLPGLTTEVDMLLIAAALIGHRWRRAHSTDAALDTAAFYLELTVLACAVMTDPRVAFGMGALVLAVWMGARRAPVRLSARVASVTPVELALLKTASRKEMDKVAWLVFFGANAADTLLSTFSELADDFPHKNVHFGFVNLSLFPEAAISEHVDTSPLSMQLPSILLYQRGAAVKRMPYLHEDGSTANLKMDRKDIIKFFALDSADGPVPGARD